MSATCPFCRGLGVVAERRAGDLTRLQRAALDVIERRIAADGVPPSIEELMDALGMRSKSGAHRVVVQLESRGHIVRRPYSARSIALPSQPATESGRGDAACLSS